MKKSLPDSEDGDLVARIAALAPWFHNMNLKGIWTAPDHFLGDYPAVKFRHVEALLPRDLGGRTVLDIGCNAGFYAIEMKRRGAAWVVGIDTDDRYLAQARLAAAACGQEIELRKLSVYDVGALGERFDLVLFMGVLYHLRHPLLALDLIREHAARDLLLFQSLQRGADGILPLAPDYPFEETQIFDAPEYPKLHFVEREYVHDWTNWWIPNRAATEALLRAAGFLIEDRAGEDIYLCRRGPVPYGDWGAGAVYPARGRT